VLWRAAIPLDEEQTMSDEILEDVGVAGYYLPEDDKARLERLLKDLALLKRMARRLRAGDDSPSDWKKFSNRVEHVAKELDDVLDETAWPAYRTAVAEAPQATPGAAASSPEAAGAGSDTEDGVETYVDHDIRSGRFVAGVTLDQIDALNRLIQMILAHGDVVSASDMADFADYTLPMMGHAIFDGAEAVRDILDQVNAQRLPEAARSRSSVKEGRAVYAVGIAPAAVDGPSGVAQRLYGPSQHAGQRMH
jgi:hypothetical protein